MDLGDLEFKADDFNFGLGAWAHAEVAKQANEILRKRLANAQKLYGNVTNECATYRWFRKPWHGHYGKTTHEGRLVCIAEMEHG